jgi:hypothetical protein
MSELFFRERMDEMGEKEAAEPTLKSPDPEGDFDAEQDRQNYFEELASVKDSILEGVITHW